MRAAILISAATIACEGSTTVVPLPPELGAGAGVVLIVSDRGGLSAFATAPGEVVSFQEDGPFELVAVETSPLSELGLSLGPLRAGAQDACPLEAALGPSQKIWAFTDGVWGRVAGSPPVAYAELSLSTSRCVTVDPRCLEYDVRVIPLGGASRPRWAQEIAEGVLVGTFNGELFLLRPDLSVEPVTSGRTIRAAWRSPTGQLWASSENGGVHRAELTSGPRLRVTQTATAPEGVLYMARATGSTVSPDILTLDPNGVVGRVHVSERVWRYVDALADPPEGEGVSGALVELAPGDVVIAWSREPIPRRYRPGAVELVAGSELSEPLTTAARSSDGSVVGFSGVFGAVFEWRDERWRSSSTSAFGAVAQTALEWNGSLYAGGTVGALRQMIPGGSFCPQRYAGGNHIRAMALLGDKLVAAAGHGDDNELVVLEAP